MKILIVGSGAREHALAWKLSLNSNELHAAPGNPGIAKHAQCHAVSVDDLEGLVGLASRLSVDLVVVGPEAPLVSGLADRLRKETIPVFGPGREAARIEGSKTFAKELMDEAGVATARWAAFDDCRRAEDYASSLPSAVIKADGLAAGKGVVVANQPDAARAAVRAIMQYGVVGAAGKKVVIEELLKGEEVSAIAICDGERYCMLPYTQDHKRLEDDDSGPNTGGMGAYSPSPVLSDSGEQEIGKNIIEPVLRVLSARGTPFVGALYAGIMMTSSGPKVLEFNCRLGDPETQPQMMRLQGDFSSILAAAAAGNLAQSELQWRKEAAVGVVLAAHGYPLSPRVGDFILGYDSLDESDELQVFHAGTRMDRGKLVTSGGRVLTVCALGASIFHARDRVYQAAARINFHGMHLRRDIAAKGLSSPGPK